MKLSRVFSAFLISFLIIQASRAQDAKLLFHIQESIHFEKIYLHTDRDFYYLGEKIWFKAYLLNGQSFSPVSGLQNIYIDVIDDQGKITQGQVLLCENGKANGCILIPDKGPTGTFMIRAYTEYIRNFGEELFFHKTIRISEVKNSFEIEANQTVKQEKKPEIDVSFFPEGGYLLAGEKNLVAFKSVDQNGKSVSLQGKVMDNMGKSISEFKTHYNGMGYFYITPKKDYQYTVKINGYPDYVYSFTDIRNEGMKLQLLAQANDKLTLEVVSNKLQHSEQLFFLVCFSKGKLLWYEAINSLLPLRMTMETVEMPKGINRFILLNEALEPVSERLVFSGNLDVNNLDVKSSQKEYTTRSLVQIDILDEIDNQSCSNLSVAVVHENSLNAKKGKQNILSYLLLDTELKGFNETPSDYFSDNDRITSQEKLDLLMLTNGWSNYLRNAFTGTDSSTIFNRTAGFQIKGKMKRSTGKKPVNGGSITMGIFESNDINWYENKTDSAGYFTFDNVFFYDTTTILVQDQNVKGRQHSEVVFDTPLKEKPIISAVTMNTMKGFQDIPIQLNRQKYYSSHKQGDLNPENETILLEEVEIKAKKVEKQDGHFRLYQKADQVLEPTDADYSNRDLFQFLRGRVAGLHIYDDDKDYGPKIYMRGFASFKGDPTPLFVIDGIPISGSDFELVRSIPMQEIDKVEILKGTSAAVYGSRGANGVIAIFTKKGSDTLLSEVDLTNMITKKVVGFSTHREFYSPQYTPENPDSLLLDHRTTLFWDPDISTEDGQAKISFFTSDNLAYYRIVVEGITNNGRICLGSAKFAVNSMNEGATSKK